MCGVGELTLQNDTGVGSVTRSLTGTQHNPHRMLVNRNPHVLLMTRGRGCRFSASLYAVCYRSPQSSPSLLEEGGGVVYKRPDSRTYHKIQPKLNCVNFKAMVFSTALLFPLFILLVHCFPGQVLRKPEGLAREYDFIIVGSGPSGLVVATRLTENPRIRVLVIESGEYVTGETEFMEVLMPTKYPGGPRSAPPLRHFWRTTTGPNPFLAGRSSIISTGKIVGGGSAVNAMVWGRAGKRDFDDWAKLVGDRGWGLRSLLFLPWLY